MMGQISLKMWPKKWEIFNFKKQMNRRFYNILDYENPQREYEEEVAVLEETDEQNKLVLWNDDVNTFDFVIECLIEICGHTLEQAEQCTILVHLSLIHI